MEFYEIIQFPKKSETNSTTSQITKTISISETHIIMMWNLVLTLVIVAMILIFLRIKRKLSTEVNYLKRKICDKISPTANAKHPGNHRFV